eukprot:SAG11_NODE_1417_length_4966_cov_4.590592_4_plen_158_part_00
MSIRHVNLLNAIRHAKFRIQKVLFRAVPSRYLRTRDIPNFRTIAQKFRSRQRTFACGTESVPPEPIYRIFVPWPYSFGPDNILLLAVRSLFLRTRDISNFRTVAQKFRQPRCSMWSGPAASSDRAGWATRPPFFTVSLTLKRRAKKAPWITIFFTGY